MSKRFWLSISVSVMALFGLHQTVAAQEQKSAAREVAPVSEETVVITAQKRAEDIQDVPVAVTAFTNAMRDKVGITSVQDIASFTPGLSYQTGLDRIYLRGIGRSTNNQASDGGTAIYTDGVYTSSTYSAATPSIFVDRIEVLRGPQGTLYGRNAIGGAINVIARRPSSVLESEVRAQYGAFRRYGAEGRLSGPLSDQLRYSVTGNYVKQEEGYYENASGLGDSGADGYNTLLEGQIEADLTPNLSAWLRVRSNLYDYSTRNGGSGAPFYTDSLVIPATVVPTGQWAAGGGGALPGSIVWNGTPVLQNPTIATGDIRKFVSDTDTQQTVKDAYDVAAEVSWDVGGVNVKYITGAVRYNLERIEDFDGSNVKTFVVPVTTNLNPAFNNPTCTLPPPAKQCATVSGQTVFDYREDKRWWSHELNVSSDNNSPVQWLGGLYYYKETYDQPTAYPYLNTPLVFNPVGGPVNPSGSVYTVRIQGNGESYAGFGQIDWQFADKWKLTGGLRYTHDKKYGIESTRQMCYSDPTSIFCQDTRRVGTEALMFDYTSFLGAVTPAKGATAPAVYDPVTGFKSRGYEGSWHATTGTLGLQWEPTVDTMLYAKYSRGYKAGGFNVGTLSSRIITEPETVDAYEVGIKARPLDNLITNVSVFHYLYEGRQTPIFVVPESGPLRSEFTNVPESVSDGVELEATWFATDNFRLLFNYAYLDSHVTEGCCYVDGVDSLAVMPGANTATINAGTDLTLGTDDDQHGQSVVGQQLPNSPKHRYTLNGLYTVHLPGDSKVDLSATYIWRDKAYAQFFNRAHHEIPDWDQIDLRATWTDSSDRYKVILFGRNVADTDGYDIAVPTYRGPTHAAPTIYKSYGITPPRTWGIELQAKF